MLLECIWVSSLLKGPSLSFSPRLILLQYPLVCWIVRIYEDIQFIHFILKSPKPSLSVQYHSRCLNRHYADLLLSIVSRGSKNDLIPINAALYLLFIPWWLQPTRQRLSVVWWSFCFVWTQGPPVLSRLSLNLWYCSFNTPHPSAGIRSFTDMPDSCLTFKTRSLSSSVLLCSSLPGHRHYHCPRLTKHQCGLDKHGRQFLTIISVNAQ